ncbi:MAG: efflux RND transporter periplasmic adaptor subunit [Sandaracinaceae bacterium]
MSRRPPGGHGPRQRSTPRSLVLALALLGSCGREGGAEEHGAGEEQAATPPRGAAGSTTGDGDGWVAASAPRDRVLAEAAARVVATPGSVAAISLPFDLQVAAVHVAPGDRVEAGAPVVDVAPPEVLRAAATFAPGRDRVRALARRLEVLEDLQGRSMVEAGRTFAVQTELEEARAKLGEARAVLAAAGVSPGEAGRVAARGSVRLAAPVDGLVRAVRAVPGEVRAAGDPPLVELIGRAPARVEGRFAGARPPDGAADLRVDLALPSRVAPAPLRWPPVGRVVSPDDGTLLAWFDPARDTPDLTPGARGVVRVRWAGPGSSTPEHPALVVPAAAVRLRDGQSHVVIRRGPRDHPRAVAVEVLTIDGASAVVRGVGLGAGDQVAIDPAVLLGAMADRGDAPR